MSNDRRERDISCMVAGNVLMEKKQLQLAGDLSLRCIASLCICGRGDSVELKKGVEWRREAPPFNP